MHTPDHIRWEDTHGVTVDAAGLVYIKHRTKTAEIMDAIVVFDAKGRFVRSFGKEYHGGGHGIDIRMEDGEEYLYLCDNKGYIAKTTLKGETIWKDSISDCHLDFRRPHCTELTNLSLLKCESEIESGARI